MIILLIIAITLGVAALVISCAYIYQRIASLRTGAYFILPFARLARPIRIDHCFNHLPIHFVVLVLLHEDDLFLKHSGVNISELLRSFAYMLKTWKKKGGSSITQQTAKCLLFSRTHRLLRKLPELFATFILEKLFTKEEILSLYLQVVPTGPGLHGIYNASKVYFSKLPKELSIAESAVLISMFPHPSTFCRNLELHQSDYSKVFDYSYAYEKVIHALRILAQIPTGNFADLVQYSVELIKQNHFPEHDRIIENVRITETAKIIHQIPRILDLIRTRFRECPNAVYYSLTPEQAVVLKLYFDCPNIPAAEMPSLRSRVVPERVLEIAINHEIEHLITSKESDGIGFEQLFEPARSSLLKIQARNLEYRRCFENLFPRFSEAKLEFLLVGGFDLALRTYTDTLMRDPQDTIFLIDQSKFSNALTVLEKNSFAPISIGENQSNSQHNENIQYPFQLKASRFVYGKIENVTMMFAGISSHRFQQLLDASEKVELSAAASYLGVSWYDNIRFIVSRNWTNLRDIADINQAMKKCSSSELLWLYKKSIDQKWDKYFLLGASLACCFGNLILTDSLKEKVYEFSWKPGWALPLAHLKVFSDDQLWGHYFFKHLYRRALNAPACLP